MVDHPSTASNSSKSAAAAAVGEKRRSPTGGGADHDLHQPKSPKLQEAAVQTEAATWEPQASAAAGRSRPASRTIRFGTQSNVARRTTSEEAKSSQATADPAPNRRRAKSEENKKSADALEKGATYTFCCRFNWRSLGVSL